jgi:hypothetical protein
MTGESIDDIKPSPPRHCRVEYGGNVSMQAYQDSLKVLNDKHSNIYTLSSIESFKVNSHKDTGIKNDDNADLIS